MLFVKSGSLLLDRAVSVKCYKISVPETTFLSAKHRHSLNVSSRLSRLFLAGIYAARPPKTVIRGQCLDDQNFSFGILKGVYGIPNLPK